MLQRARLDPHVESHVPLAPLTTLELGGRARWYVRARTEAELLDAVALARAKRWPLFVLGGGSNVVVPDGGIDGLVLHIETRGRRAEARGDEVRVTLAAGEPWDAFVADAVARGWAGVECLSGIPGQVGATPIQNVGAYGQQVGDVLRAVRVLETASGRVLELAPHDCDLDYRTSVFRRAPGRHVVLSVTLALRRGPPAPIRYDELQRALPTDRVPTLGEVRAAVLALRRAKSMVLDPDDPNRRSVGSFFVNPTVDRATADALVHRALADGLVDRPEAVPCWPQPDGRVRLAAAWLVERAGYPKGSRRGPVGVSTRHALALVHHGGGSARELLALADEIAVAVERRFGIRLEREPVVARPIPI
ncbi:MAG: UDP-N-acetylmuramate dehydrogenase [Myxococcota bacterium]|nr:UDP-N-acetylmuramate dehydrogenase [Myxococcota bacterium]MDW8362501.1 UDP-N-acetylmuramate dehydrogenase [Myxococcales bacterium]